MKRVTLFLLLSFFVGFNAMSQITTTIVDFEKAPAPTDPASNYTVSNSLYYNRLDTLKVEGNYSIRLIPNKNEEVSLTIENIRKTASQHLVLEFHHICLVRTNLFSDVKSAQIFVKEHDDSKWVRVNGNSLIVNEYEEGATPRNFTEGGSSSSGYFSNLNYRDVWGNSPNLNLSNSNWKKEVLLLTEFITGLGAKGDLFDIKFVVPKVTFPTATILPIEGWYIDSIAVKVSDREMIKPDITMLSYPAPMYFPENAPAKISAYVGDTAMLSKYNSGINQDSSYLIYKYGNDPEKKLKLNFRSEGNGVYFVDANIPFQGYDTLINWKLVVRDNTSNLNEQTYPWNNGWSQFIYTRSLPHQDSLGKGVPSDSIPLFYSNENNKSTSYLAEFVYDKEILSKNGYSSGVIDALKLKFLKSSNQTLQLTIRMQNISEKEALAAHNKQSPTFGLKMQEVYSADYKFPASTGEQWMENFVQFDTPFKYSGEYVLLQICVSNAAGNSIDPLVIKGIVAPNSSSYYPSIYKHSQTGATSACDYSSPEANYNTTSATRTADVIFRTIKGNPIEYDLGVSKITSPVEKVFSLNQNIIVRLSNFGSKRVDKVRIFYKIDEDGAIKQFDYTGGIAPFSNVDVTVGTEILDEGLRRIYAWTNDSVGVGASTIRDYEERNNSTYDSVYVCEGAIKENQTIGFHKDAVFKSIQDALDFSSMCGIDDDITFDIWSGLYEQNKIVFPEIPGLDSYSITLKAHPDSNVVVEFTINDLNEGGLIDFANAQNIRFENIKFRVKGIDNTFVSLANMSSVLEQNENIEFKNCQFVSEVGIGTIIRAVGMKQLIVDSCIFEGANRAILFTNATGGRIGSASVVRNSRFLYQKEALGASNQKGLVIENNEFISSNEAVSSYVVKIENCTESPIITSNTISSRAGSPGILLTGVNGTSTEPAIFANNMVSVVGVSALTAVELKNSKYLNFVYNSIRIKSENTKQIPVAARIGSLGTSLESIVVKNNIFYNAKKGFSVYIIPTGTIESDYNNFAKTESEYLGMYGTGSTALFSSLDILQARSGQEAHSINKRVIFIEDFNLKTYSIDLIEKGTPISGIDKDKFGGDRDNSKPCIGAFEYEKLPVNIAIDELQISPTDDCGLSNEPVTVTLRNYGKNTISSATVHYQIVGGSASFSKTLSSSIDPNDSFELTFDDLVNLSVDGFKRDSVFEIKVWVDNLMDDLDTGNDTIRFNILSLYQLEKLNISGIPSVKYEEKLTFNILDYANPRPTDSIFWFDKDGKQIGYGPECSTGTLYNDTTYYVAQMHEEAILKFTEIQLAGEGDGLPVPYPYTDLKGIPNLAVRISNLGNIDADLSGKILSIAGDYNDYKSTPLPNRVLEPKKSLVFIFSGAAFSRDSSEIIYLPRAVDSIVDKEISFELYSTSGSDSNKIYHDYVSVNSSLTNPVGTVWEAGTSVVTKNTNTIGIRRVSQEPNASAWFVITDEQPLKLETLNEEIVIYDPAKNCMGEKTPVTINVTGIPLYDAVISFVSQDRTDCNLQDEEITIKVTNWGNVNTINEEIKAYYTIDDGVPQGGEIVNEGIILAPGESHSYKFKQKADLRSSVSDKEFTIKAFIERLSGEGNAGKANDTTLIPLKITSLRTPVKPTVTIDTVSFKGTASLKAESVEDRDSLKWYAKDGTLLTTHKTYETGALEDDTTFYVQAFDLEKTTVTVLDGNTVYQITDIKNMRTSPYYSGSPSVVNNIGNKAQYIIDGRYLIESNIQIGSFVVSGLEFFLESMTSTAADEDLLFDNYQITLMNTPRTGFLLPSNNVNDASLEVDTEPHYQRSDLHITKDDVGTWISHPFDRTFEWDGESSILVQICRKPNPAYINRVNTSTRNFISPYGEYGSLCSTVDCETQIIPSISGGTVNTTQNLPSIRFVFEEHACATDSVEKKIVIKDKPEKSAEVIAIYSPAEEGNEIGTINLDIEIRNDGIQSFTNLPIKWKIEDNDNVIIDEGAGEWTGTLSKKETSKFFKENALNVATPGYYTLKVWTDMLGDQNHKGDTMSMKFRVCYPEGNYRLSKTDIGADFSSFKDALTKLSAAGICGNVVVEVGDGEYNEQLNVPAIPGAGNGNYLTFTSESGNNTSVKLKYKGESTANYVVNIEDVKGIIFDNLTINSLDDLYSKTFRIKNSQDIKLTNNNIISKYYAKSDPERASITLTGVTDRIEISNNIIDSSYVGVRVDEDKNAKKEVHQNLKISNNTITNFYYSGIELYKTENLSITGNYIKTERDLKLTGIYINGDKNGFNISENEVILHANIKNANNQSMYGIFITNSSIGDGVSTSLLSNNMVSIRRSISGSFNPISAIRLSGSDNIDIYHNTARVSPTTDNSNTARVVDIIDNSNNIRFKNNNLINANGGLVLLVQNKASFLESDYNNFYSSANSMIKVGNMSNPSITLSSWIITSKGMDENTIQKNYPFVSDINLRQREPDLLFLGTSIENVLYDIDSTRRPNIPSIGAHEYERESRDITPLSIYCSSPSTVFQEDGDMVVGLNIRNVGYLDVDTIIIGVKSARSMVKDTTIYIYSTLKAKSDINQIDTRYFEFVLPLLNSYVGADTLIVFTDIWGETPETRKNDTIRYIYEIKPGYDFKADKKPIFIPEIKGSCGTDSTKVAMILKNETRRTLSTSLGKKLKIWLEVKETAGSTTNTSVYARTITSPGWDSIISQSTDTIIFDTIFRINTKTNAAYSYSVRYWVDYEGDMNPANDTSAKAEFEVNQKPKKPEPVSGSSNLTINFASKTFLQVKNDPAASKFVWYDTARSVIKDGSREYQTPLLETPGATYYVVGKSSGGCPSDTLTYRISIPGRENNDARPLGIHNPKDNLVYTHTDTIRLSFKNEGKNTIYPSSNLNLVYLVEMMKIDTVKLYPSAPVRYDTSWVEVSSARELYEKTLSGGGTTEMFSFQKLAEFPKEGNVYAITVYTDLPNDDTRSNDTIYKHIFTSGNSNTYCDVSSAVKNYSGNYGIDISNVSFGMLDNETSSVGNKYTNFASDTTALPMFEVYRGIEQMLSVTCNSTTKPELNQSTLSGWVKVYIDWNRNGVFEVNKNEEVLSAAFDVGKPVQKSIIIPETYIDGAMKMRVIASPDYEADQNINPCLTGQLNNGEVEDYKLFVRSLYTTNAALSKITAPSQVLMNPEAELKVMLHNTGKSELASGTIKYRFSEDSTAEIYTYSISTPIASGSSQEISLGNHYFEEGIVPLTVWLEISGDDNPADDTLRMNIYSPPIRTITYRNDFNSDEVGFLAPEGEYYIHRNLWKKDSLWRIERSFNIKERAGNLSYLYSPIFDIADVKPDSLSFDLSRELSTNSRLYVEYLNKDNEWVQLGKAKGDDYATNWYNDEVSNSFTGKFKETQTCNYSLFNSLDGKLGDIFQIRFVFVTTAEPVTEPNYVRIDNFILLRSSSLRDMEVAYHIGGRNVGYGDDYYPAFVIKNSGTTEVTSCVICYGITPPSLGNYTERCISWTGRLGFEETDTVKTMDEKYNAAPIKITHHMGDTVTVCAYTKLNMEEKSENDTACMNLYIERRANDLAMSKIIFPLDNNTVPAVSPVTVRILNFGNVYKKQGTVSYMVDNKNPITVDVDFVELLGGNGLEPGDSIDFTFPDSLYIDFYGKMLITAYVGMDEYMANNTLSKYVQGVSSLKDIKAERIILNNLGNGELEVQLDILNQGTVGVNLFDVGFTCFIGLDTISVSEVFWREKSLQSLQKGYHKFDIKLFVTDMAMIDGICAYVSLPGDNNIANDTTCQIYIGYIDMSPTVLMIEEDPLDSKCRMMLNVENKGTIVVDEVKLDVTVDNTTHSMIFNEYSLTPGKTFGILLDSKIDKKGNYKVLSKVTTKGDINPANDTSSRYEATPIIVGIDDVDSVDLFRLEQNYPNPFTETTEFKFNIPTGGNVKVFVIDNRGQFIVSEEKFYAAGENTYRVSNRNLASGVYFYGVEYNGVRKIKKMIHKK